KTGGLIGIGAESLSQHVADVFGLPWLAIMLPLLLLIAGAPLAFLATGLRIRPIWRGIVNVPAFFVWLGSQLRMPSLRRYHADFDHDDAYEDDDGYSLGFTPEPVAANTETAAARASRVRREEAAARPAASPKRT